MEEGTIMTEQEMLIQEDNFLTGRVKCGWIIDNGNKPLCTASGKRGILDSRTTTCDKDSCPIMLEVVYCGKHKVREDYK